MNLKTKNMFSTIFKRRERLDTDQALASLVIVLSRQKKFIPCKMCGRHDDKVKPTQTLTGVEVGYLHPWCASQLIQEAMKELVARMK